MGTESALRFGVSPMVFSDRMCCSPKSSARGFLLWMVSNASDPEQVFGNKSLSTLRTQSGPQWAIISCDNASKGGTETISGSSTRCRSDLPAAICTTGLGVQNALADPPLSGGELVETEEQMEQLKALAKLAAFRQGRILESRVFRQTFVIRSYEVGPDGTTSIDTLASLFQEVFINHTSLLGISGDGFGATVEMNRHRLIWVITRLHVEVERYPSWPEVVEIDSWIDGAGRSGMRRDWLVREEGTGVIIAKATSTWAMINQDTRRLSKMPEDVRTQLSPAFIQRYATKEALEKIRRLDDTAQNIQSNLTPCSTDLDGNFHVNNVRYVRWVMESTPKQTLENWHLSCLTLEYRRECNIDDIIQSLTDLVQHNVSGINSLGFPQLENPSALTGRPENGNSMYPNGTAGISSSVEGPTDLTYTHLLRMQSKGEEIVRGRTVWTPQCKRH